MTCGLLREACMSFKVGLELTKPFKYILVQNAQYKRSLSTQV